VAIGKRAILIAAMLAASLWLVPGAFAFGPVAGSPFAAGTDPSSAAFSPSGSLLAVANSGLLTEPDSGSVSMYSVNQSTGALTQVGSPTQIPDGEPSSVAFSPSGGLLAVADEDQDSVSMFSVSQSGALTPVPDSPFSGAGGGPDDVSFSPSGNLLAVADVDDGVTIMSVGQSGALTRWPDSPFATGGVSGVAFNPSGDLLAAAGIAGSPISGAVGVFSVDASNEELDAVPASPFTAGNSPYGVAFSPDGSLLAVTNQSGGNVSMFTVDASTGALANVAGSPVSAGTNPAGVAFSPAGNQLVVSDTTGSQLFVYGVNPSSGVLSASPGSPFPLDNGTSSPFTVAYSPSGAWLAIPEESSNDVSVFSATPSPPTATISSPATGQTYTQGQVIPTTFACAEGSAGTGLQACVDSNGTSGTTATVDGALNTTTVGSHTYTVTATSTDTDTATAQITYTVEGPPSATVTTPANGASYTEGQVVDASFSCQEGVYGPGLASTGGCQGTVANGSPIDTSKPGTYSFSVTAASQDGQTSIATSQYTVTAAPPSVFSPANTARPALTGTGTAGGLLKCSRGKWTNSPTGYSYQWSRDGTPIQGAKAASYKVQSSDQELTLTCAVTASNVAGAGSPAVSRGLSIAVPKVSRCPAATGRVSGTGIGQIKLGMTRAQARRAYSHSSDKAATYNDFFCLTPIGIRAGYASPKLLDGLSAGQRRKLQGRVVWASTASAYYDISGVRVGATIAAAGRELKLEQPFQTGGGSFYLVPDGAATAILKVHDGIVEEIGIADKQVTSGRAAQRRFLTSFS
jgi:6-phosphogluconolactonase